MFRFDEFSLYVSAFLQKKGWTPSCVDNELTFSKNYIPEHFRKTNLKFLLDDKEFYKKLSVAFQKTGLQKEILNSMRNNNQDTDLIVAGLQKANNYIQAGDYSHRSFYTFQPVTRFNGLDKCGQEDGFLSSFVNIATVDINTSMEEYLKRLDSWLSILSDISLHTSGIQLKLKKIADNRNYNGAQFNNGMKTKLCYKGLNIGVANLFEVKHNNHTFLVSDFGSSYERLLWCINGKDNFYTPLLSHYETLYGNKRKNDRIRTATLMVMTGIKPSAKGIGLKLRSIIREVTELADDSNVTKMIDHFYSYYGKFIQPELSKEQTQYIINSEVENAKKLLINRESPNLNSNKSIEVLCTLKLIKMASTPLFKLKENDHTKGRLT